MINTIISFAIIIAVITVLAVRLCYTKRRAVEGVFDNSEYRLDSAEESADLYSLLSKSFLSVSMICLTS